MNNNKSDADKSWDILQNKLHYSPAESFDILIQEDFSSSFLNQSLHDFPKKIPNNVGTVFEIKNKVLKKMFPNAPYISYDFGVSLIKFIHSINKRDDINFSLLNCPAADFNGPDYFVDFFKKFNINAKTHKSKKIKRFFRKEKHSFLGNGDFKNTENYDFIFAWEKPTASEFRQIMENWTVRDGWLLFVDKKNDKYLKHLEFNHPELGEYSIYVV